MSVCQRANKNISADVFHLSQFVTKGTLLVTQLYIQRRPIIIRSYSQVKNISPAVAVSVFYKSNNLLKENPKWREEIISADSADQATSQEKCSKQFVQTAARNAKFHSSRQKEDRFTAVTALTSTDRQETQDVSK